MAILFVLLFAALQLNCIDDVVFSQFFFSRNCACPLERHDVDFPSFRPFRSVARRTSGQTWRLSVTITFPLMAEGCEDCREVQDGLGLRPSFLPQGARKFNAKLTLGRCSLEGLKRDDVVGFKSPWEIGRT